MDLGWTQVAQLAWSQSHRKRGHPEEEAGEGHRPPAVGRVVRIPEMAGGHSSGRGLGNCSCVLHSFCHCYIASYSQVLTH